MGVVVEITDAWNDRDGKVYEYGEVVQDAQDAYDKTDKNADIVRHEILRRL